MVNASERTRQPENKASTDGNDGSRVDELVYTDDSRRGGHIRITNFHLNRKNEISLFSAVRQNNVRNISGYWRVICERAMDPSHEKDSGSTETLR